MVHHCTASGRTVLWQIILTFEPGGSLYAYRAGLTAKHSRAWLCPSGALQPLEIAHTLPVRSWGEGGRNGSGTGSKHLQTTSTVPCLHPRDMIMPCTWVLNPMLCSFLLCTHAGPCHWAAWCGSPLFLPSHQQVSLRPLPIPARPVPCYFPGQSGVCLTLPWYQGTQQSTSMGPVEKAAASVHPDTSCLNEGFPICTSPPLLSATCSLAVAHPWGAALGLNTCKLY